MITVGYEPDELHGGISGRMRGRHADRDRCDRDLVETSSCWKLSRCLHFSNEYHDSTDQHLHLYPLSFPPYAHFYTMPDHGDENNPLTSSKKFGSIRFRRLSISSKRRSELKAAISGPRIFDGGGASATVLGDAPLRTLNSAQLLHTNSASAMGGLSPPQETFARDLRRNSDIPLRKDLSNLAWPTNHPGISPVRESPRPNRAALKKPRKADISKPLIPESPRLSNSSGVSPKRSRRSAQINRGPRFSGTAPSSILKRNSEGVTSPKLSSSDSRPRSSNLLDTPFDGSDPRTMMESFPALDLGLNAGAVSFGSVKERTGKIDKALRASRTTLLLASQETAKPELMYADDSDAFSSPPSTPLIPAWETMVTSSMPEADPKLATKLELADVHAQIQAMIDSANHISSVNSGDFPGQDQESLGAHGEDILPYLRPNSPMYKSFPRHAITHRRSASSPPLGSGVHYAYPPDFGDRLLYRPITPVKQTSPLSFSSPPSKTPSTPISPTSAGAVAPSTPTKKSLSEKSDSPSVYSQQSPSSQIDDTTPTSSSTSSPDHPHGTSKHERLLAAISEGISSPTKPGPTAPSVLGSRHSRSERSDLARPYLRTDIPAVPVIVVTDPNDGNLVYSESNFSIVDMYASPAESVEAGQRRRTRTTHSVSHTAFHALATR